MSTQSKPVSRLKLHTINVTPSGSEMVGQIESGKSVWQFNFLPTLAKVVDWRLVLTGRVTITPPVGRPRTVDGVTARLLATQGSTALPPDPPTGIDQSLTAPSEASVTGLPLTEYSGNDGSIAVMFLKLSPLNGSLAGIPYDMGGVQLNARLWANSTLERDLLWLYSALVMATQGPKADGKWADGLLTEINQRLTK
ncbi:MAG: hypothetical protein EBU88_12510 [Acidobacteria bacterium]|nr:hypothetical protein [Acidobacteriota bacterium]